VKNNEPHVQPRVGRSFRNGDELVKALKCDNSITVEKVDFTGMPIEQQIAMIRRTNILIGMSGAGLTHSVFLPEQAVCIAIE
jgi:protein O-GlcNAc transferase